MIVGRSQLAAPMSVAGVVLSQPASSTTPSIGLARIDSSTSMEARFRNSIVEGRMRLSPRLMTGNSMGKPPASHTPRLTWSASARKWALHGASSENVLQMPMTGRPSKASSGTPSLRTQLRCRMPSRPGASNQAALRRRRGGRSSAAMGRSIEETAAPVSPRRGCGPQAAGAGGVDAIRR